MSTWTKENLFQLGSVARGKSKHRPRNDSSLYGGSYPFIQTSDIKHSNFYVTKYEQTYNDVGLKQSKLWPEKTLCITIAANIAESGILTFPACFPDSVVGFIADPKKSNVLFVKYALDYAKKNFQKTAKGTAQDNLSLSKIKTIKIDVPEDDIDKQNKIASVLSAYDDLIENNEKRIKILEEMAERLYREWFVKFKFSGHEKVRLIDSGTEYGKIPEGWEVKNLNDVSNIVFGFNFKSKGFKENGKGVRVVRIRDVLSGFTNTFTTEEVDKKYEILPGDLLIGMDGIFHMQMWYMEKCFLNQRVAGIKSKLPTYFLSESIKKQLYKLQKTIVGATVGHLANGDVKEFKIVLPLDRNLLTPFEGITKKIVNIKLQNQNLSKIRDLLIPQLVTGKREIKN